MNIKTMVIEGANEDIKIRRTVAGATASVERYTRREGKIDKVLAEFGRGESRESRYAKSAEVAKAVYGADRQGRPAATNSMIQDVLDVIERVAGF